MRAGGSDAAIPRALICFLMPGPTSAHDERQESGDAAQSRMMDALVSYFLPFSERREPRFWARFSCKRGSEFVRRVLVFHRLILEAERGLYIPDSSVPEPG